MNIFSNHTIKTNIIKITLIVTLLITLSTASICFSFFNRLLSNSLSESTHYTLKLIMNNFSNNMDPILSLSNWCSNKDTISKYLVADDTKSISLVAWQRLKEEYLNNPSAQFIQRIVIGNSSKHYLHTSNLTSTNTFNMVDRITTLPYFDELYNANDFKWIGFVPSLFENSQEQLSIPIIRPVFSPYSSNRIGWCYISISSDILTTSFKNYSIPTDSDLYLTIDNKTYHIIDNTLIEIPTRPIALNTSKHETYYSTIVNKNGKKHTLITVGSKLQGWYLTQSLSEKQFAAQKQVYINLVLIMCCIVLFLGCTLAFYLDRLINFPLSKITKKIQCLSIGDFSYDPSIEWDNELGKIGSAINTLSKDVVQLMETRLENEREKKEIEYQMLQSQINPHFLYNTLNSIKWMATIQQATGIVEMTTALSRLMRSVSKDTKQIVTLQDELSLLDNYFLIQKYRYGGTLSLEYNIESDDLKDCNVLKFTLQPIVENAIFHGIEPKGEAGIITIGAKRLDEDTFCITITDNGVGMSEEQISNILCENNHSNTEFFKKLGINNVHKRIQYTFGIKYGIKFTSVLHQYTTVTITFPYQFISSHSERSVLNDQTFNC